MACSNCNNVYLPHVERIYYAAITGDPFNYLFTGDTIIINDSAIFYRLGLQDESTEFSQNVTTDSTGQYFDHQFKLSLIDFNNPEGFSLDNKRLVFIFEDLNGNMFIAGYDEPLSVSDIQAKIDGSGNGMSVTVSSKSYSPIRPVKKQCWYHNECCPDLQFNIITTQTDTPETANGTITVNVSGGSGNYMYALDHAKTTYQSSNHFDGLPHGNYQVYVRDMCVAGNCVNTHAVTVPVKPTFTIESNLKQNFSPLQWRVLGSNGAQYYLTQAVTADTQTIPIILSSITLSAKKDNNSGIAQGSGSVVFKRNGIVVSTVSYSTGANMSTSPPQFTYTGLTNGDVLRVEVVEQITENVIVTIGNFGSNSEYINWVKFNGVDVDVTGGSFPVPSGGIVYATTDEVGASVSVEVNISYPFGSPYSWTVTFNPPSGMATCQTVTTSGNYYFTTALAIGESCSVGVGNGTC